MKKYIPLAAAIALGLSGCSSDNGPSDSVSDAGVREITVNVAPISRTTIEYENSDFSHLVWQDGDQVAYVTDATGDTFRAAAIDHNAFSATVPSGAKSLTVVYPLGNLVGKTLSEAVLKDLNPATLNLDASFDGTRLPMVSSMDVPEGSSVTATFDVLPAVVRISFAGNTENAGQIIKSISLKANENLSGSYALTGKSWAFNGSAREIECAVSADKPSIEDVAANKNYAYMVLPRSVFTGFTLAVTTDQATYTFPDGQIDLTDPTKSLYRLDVVLGEPDPIPSDPKYVKITSASQITTGDDDRYLIVCEGKNVMFAQFDSGNYHPGVSISIPQDGIDPESADAKKCQIILSHPSGDFSSRFIINPPNIKSGKPYVAVMANFSSSPAKLAFLGSVPTDNSRAYWDITFDSDGNALFQGHPNTQDVDGDVFLGYNNSKKAFCVYGADASASDYAPLQLYKLSK